MSPRKILFLFILVCSGQFAYSQHIHKIKTDSLLVTNDSCNAEFILENSTRDTIGFLYNRGRGRTEFRRGVIKLSDTTYLFGADTLKISGLPLWSTKGNANTNPSINFLGTTDNTRLVFRTNNSERATILSNGNFGIGTDNPSRKLVVNGDASFSTTYSVLRYSATGQSYIYLGRDGDTYVNFHVQPDFHRGFNFSAQGTVGHVQALGEYGKQWERFVVSVYNTNGYKAHVDIGQQATVHSRFARTGNLLVGTTTEDSIHRLQVNGSTKSTRFNFSSSFTPASTTDTLGSIGDLTKDNDYLYLKTDSGWKRTKLSWTPINPFEPFQDLTDSSTVLWDINQGTNATISLAGNRTLDIANIANGIHGKLIIKQDSVGGRVLNLPINSLMSNQTMPSINYDPNAVDVLSFIYDGQYFYWTFEKNFSPITAKFNFNAQPHNVAGWVDVSGNPHQAVRTAYDPNTGIGVSSISTTKWNGSFGSASAFDGAGETTPNPSFAFNFAVTNSYWYAYNTTYSTSADCNIEINGLQVGSSYKIEILGSRDDSGVPGATRLMRAVCVDNSGTSTVEDFDTKGNTANLITFTSKTPDSNGKILLFVGKKTPADGSHQFGYLNAIRVTKL